MPQLHSQRMQAVGFQSVSVVVIGPPRLRFRSLIVANLNQSVSEEISADDRQAGRLAEHQPGRRRRVGGQPHVGAPAAAACATATRASRRARSMPMHTCGPAANARCRRTFGRWRSKRSGSGNSAGSRLAPASETTTSVAGRDRRAGQLDVTRRVAVDDSGGRLDPQRLLDGRRHELRVGRRPRRGRRRRRAGSHRALRIMPSVVSMPPNMMTAALDTCSSPAERRPVRGAARTASASSAIARAPSAVGARPAPMPDTEATMSRYQASRRRDDTVRPGRRGRGSRRRRPRRAARPARPAARPARRGRRPGGRPPPATKPVEALGDLARPVGGDVRVAVAGVGGRRRARACSGRRPGPWRTAGRRR